MKLQVQQASMLMDLLRQKATREDELDLSSSVHPSIANGQIQGGSTSVLSSHKSLLSHKTSYQSLQQHKSTVDLIQAIYKQMEKINAQLSQKHPGSD